MLKAMMERLLYEVEHYIERIDDRLLLRIVSAALYGLARMADERAQNMPEVIVEAPESPKLDIADVNAITEVIQ